MKILLVSNGARFQGVLFAKSLRRFCETDILSLNKNLYLYDSGVIEEEGINFSEDKSYDVIFGTDQMTLPLLENIKKANYKGLIGNQLLDYPRHVLDKNNRCYNEKEETRWAILKSIIPSMDFIIYSKKNVPKDLQTEIRDIPSLYSVYPIMTMPVKNYRDDKYVVYSGRVTEDRRICSLIKMISLSKNKPKLFISTVVNKETIDYSLFAKDMGVEYKVFDSLSERDKFDLYEGASFIVSCHYDYCPAGCVPQGISIGKNALCFTGGDISRETFGDSIEYANEDEQTFISKLDSLCSDIKTREKDREKRIDFYNKNLTYEIWAEKIYNFVRKYDSNL